MPDPFITLALAASATKRIRLGTGICLVPERDPIMLAKEVATIDYYSGGRFIFGIGAGWLADETEIMGVEFKKRWEVTRGIRDGDEGAVDRKGVELFRPVRAFPQGQVLSQAAAKAPSADPSRAPAASAPTSAHSR